MSEPEMPALSVSCFLQEGFPLPYPVHVNAENVAGDEVVLRAEDVTGSEGRESETTQIAR